MSVRKVLLLSAALLAGTVAAKPAAAQDSRAMTTVAFSTDELDNLLAPIALYPDAILAQVLIAATFPDQIELAARFVRSRGTRDIDDQPWDVSVKSVAHYPPVLNMLADRPDWTTALGQAYAMQSSDVMESVQHLREMANAQGNLRSTSQQNVVVDGRYIRIEPAQPRVIFVPTYDPEIIYYRPVVQLGIYTGHWSFGVGFPIGAWLAYDCDWYGRRVYYTGWNVNFGWRVVAYPYIRITPVYVHPRYDVVYVNRTVVHRYVDYDRLRGYNTVHRTVTYDNHRRTGGPGPIQRDVYDRRDDNRGGRDPRNDGRANPRNDGRNDNRNDGRNDPRNDGRNDTRNDNRNDDRGSVGPRNDGRTDPRNDTRTDPRNDTRTNGRTDPPARRDEDRTRQTTPPVNDDKRTQSRSNGDAGSERRGGVFAPRQAEPASRPSPRTTESRPSNSDRRASSPPPSRASSPPSRSSGSSARQSPPSSSGKRESSGGGSHGSPARGKRG